jgi:hypothetical protein
MSHTHLEEKREQEIAKEEEEKQHRARASSPNAGLKVAIQCDTAEIQTIIEAYNNHFGGKPGYKAPKKNTDGSIVLEFPNKGDAELFALGEAQKGQKMLIIDSKTQTVLGYSNGDGKLYQADGTEMQEGESFSPSNISSKDFSIPEPRKLGM